MIPDYENILQGLLCGAKRFTAAGCLCEYTDGVVAFHSLKDRQKHATLRYAERDFYMIEVAGWSLRDLLAVSGVGSCFGR